MIDGSIRSYWKWYRKMIGGDWYLVNFLGNRFINSRLFIMWVQDSPKYWTGISVLDKESHEGLLKYLKKKYGGIRWKIQQK